MNIDVKKEDMRRKARHVVGGHKIDSSHLESHSSVAQSTSKRLLLTMAEKIKLKIVAGDVGNTFPNVPTKEKVHAIAGEEFGERQGCIVEFTKSPHGMVTASRSFALCLGDFIRTLGLFPTRADPGTHTKKDPNYEGFSCASTHVDDFLIIGTDLESIIEKFKEKFDIVHEEVNPTSYLGSQWECSALNKRKIHNEKHAKEAIGQLEKDLGIQLKKENVPTHPKHHPELEISMMLAEDEMKNHQKFAETLQWTQSSLRFDACLAVSSLARRQHNPR